MDDEASTTQTDLQIHLAREHSGMLVLLSDEDCVKNNEELTYLESDFEEEDGRETTEQNIDIPIDKRKILRNGAWEYFEVADEEQKVATCILCRDKFSYRTSSTNLAKHLQRRHCIEYAKVTNKEKDGDDGDDDDDLDEKETMDKRRAKTSTAWEYFTIKDPVKRIATCKICSKHFSYLTSVTNLMRHMQHKHFIDDKVKCKDETETIQTFEEEEIDLSKYEDKKHGRSSVWLYFKCIDNKAKIGLCLICKKKLSFLTSITNLKKHLFRKHPRVQLDSPTNDKKMLLSSDGQLYEIEDVHKREPDAHNDDDQSGDDQSEDDQNQNEPLELDTVYLNEYEPIQHKRKRHTLKRSKKYSEDKRTYLNEATGVQDALSSDEEITLQKRYVRKKDNNSLDQFGKYLAALLKQLPKELSNQLQADFVKQVMSAQLSYESQKVVVAPSNGYAITITESRSKDKLTDTTQGNS